MTTIKKVWQPLSRAEVIKDIKRSSYIHAFLDEAAKYGAERRQKQNAL